VTEPTSTPHAAARHDERLVDRVALVLAEAALLAEGAVVSTFADVDVRRPVAVRVLDLLDQQGRLASAEDRDLFAQLAQLPAETGMDRAELAAWRARAQEAERERDELRASLQRVGHLSAVSVERLLADRDRLTATNHELREWLVLRDGELVAANEQRDQARAEVERLRRLVDQAIDVGFVNDGDEIARIRREAGLT
jgi:hypothetical protein